jgi:hypothetical protein
VIGPSYKIPRINAGAQSARSNQADAGNVAINEGDIPTRTIDRESLIQDQQELYGRT